jgi:hypothetical protein
MLQVPEEIAIIICVSHQLGQLSTMTSDAAEDRSYKVGVANALRHGDVLVQNKNVARNLRGQFEA